MTALQQQAQRVKEASFTLALCTTEQKNNALLAIADALLAQSGAILQANARDIENAQQEGIAPAMVDRLRLTSERLGAIAQAVRDVARLPDPIGEVMEGFTRPNGLKIQKVRVPLGVVGMIFEARPNVTVDAAVLCLKTSNACLLRGGKEAFLSNKALAVAMQQALASQGLPRDCISLIEDTSRESANEMMHLNNYLDVLIPRGGAGLIDAVVKNATVPVIQTGVGNCHIFVDESADLQQAVNIVDNAKTSRPSVCNACETVLVHAKVANDFLPMMQKALQAHHVQIRGCERTRAILEQAVPATEQDFATEFNEYILAVKVVDSFEEAILHIRRYSTGHSEAILTENYAHAMAFCANIDAAAVYVNASTRFTDGGEFGFGAEIGISTQKLHARGPMGLKELTSSKYIIFGQGQIR